jgi:hypothetical protein
LSESLTDSLTDEDFDSVASYEPPTFLNPYVNQPQQSRRMTNIKEVSETSLSFHSKQGSSANQGSDHIKDISHGSIRNDS